MRLTGGLTKRLSDSEWLPPPAPARELEQAMEPSWASAALTCETRCSVTAPPALARRELPQDRRNGEETQRAEAQLASPGEARVGGLSFPQQRVQLRVALAVDLGIREVGARLREERGDERGYTSEQLRSGEAPGQHTGWVWSKLL